MCKQNISWISLVLLKWIYVPRKASKVCPKRLVFPVVKLKGGKNKISSMTLLKATSLLSNKWNMKLTHNKCSWKMEETFLNPEAHKELSRWKTYINSQNSNALYIVVWKRCMYPVLKETQNNVTNSASNRFH